MIIINVHWLTHDNLCEKFFFNINVHVESHGEPYDV
jgi:hypothetical protein